MRGSRFAGINIEAAVRLVILLGFALFFYVTVTSGRAQYYVHPRIVPYMKFGIVAMVLIALSTARTLFKPGRRKAQLLPYMLFIIPLISAFILPAKVIDASSIASSSFMTPQLAENADSNNGPYSGDSDANISDEIDESRDTIINDTSEENTDDTWQYTEGTSDSGGSDAAATAEAAAYGTDESDSALKLKGNTIVVGNDNFVLWNDEIYYDVEKYKGKKIEITVKVFKDKNLKENGFGIVRMMMSCCAADLQPVGLICRYDRAGELKGGTWLKVTGIIDTETYEGEETPIIKVDSVQSADKPEDEYVYP